MSNKINRKTHEIDASDQILGRLASKIAIILRGKNKADFTPNVDAGDFVVVKNVAKIKLTGNKPTDKVYHHHSGYLGGLKTVKVSDLLKTRPDQILHQAVLRMLPKNRLQKKFIKRLKFL